MYEEVSALEVLERWVRADEFLVFRRGVVRLESLAGVVGNLKYVEDHVAERCLYARIVRSPYPHGLIRSLSLKNLHGDVHLITASDIPGKNQVGYAIADQPVLADGKVRFAGEPVALVVGSDPYEAADMLEEVELDIEPLEAVLDPLEALEDKVLVHEEKGTNLVMTAKVRKGDVERGESESDYVVEDTYSLGPQDHAYLEPEAALAIPIQDGMLIISQAQYPHLAQRTVARVLGIPSSSVTIAQPAIGGAFGGKDDMGPIVSAQAALASWILRRPVMLTYSREESLTSHCKRDPAIIKYRSGASSYGELKFVSAEIIFDAGAYANRGPYTLWRAVVHATGPYRVPNVHVEGKLVYTNKIYQGSFRGFGNPQSQFAAERQMDELAIKIGMDPIEFRLKNALRPGDESCTGQVLDESTGMAQLLREMVKRGKRQGAEVKLGDGRYAYGVGVACAWHGISTSRGAPDWGSSTLTVFMDGSVLLQTGIVEFGQGTHTGLRQIAASVLGIPYDYVRIEGGSSRAPDTGATHGSRGLTFGGSATIIAAAKIRERVLRVAASMLECREEDLQLRDGKIYVKDDPSRSIDWAEAVRTCYRLGVDLTASGHFFMPKGRFNEDEGRGFAYAAYSYAVILVEVEVDLETGNTRVLRIVPGIASGRIINAELAEGQIHGAAVQGLGYALLEELRLEEGRIVNATFMDYLIPSAQEVPTFEEPIYVEDLFRYGPFGAKGLAEMALIPIPAAIANAVRHATGVKIRRIPIRSDELLASIKSRDRG